VRKLRLESAVTLGGLMDLVVEDIKKGESRGFGYRLEVDFARLAV